MADEFMCGSRAQQPGSSQFPGPDKWRVEKNGDRTCSYCGSLHPEDFEAILTAYANGDPGYRFDTTTKGYKRYASRPGVTNAGEGGIKFYTWHLPPDEAVIEKLNELHKRAVERLRVEMDALLAPKH